MEIPEVTKDGLTFLPVPEFDAVSVAMGADEECFFHRRSLPKVPREFEQQAEKLFFSGGEIPDFAPDVDRAKAAKAIRAWLCSFAPAHESKVATVGYALWVWSVESGKTRAAQSAA